MVDPEPSIGSASVTVVPRRPSIGWSLWIPVSVVAAVVGALAAWQIRAFPGSPTPRSLGQDLAYIATLVSALIVGGAQWLLLRRYRIEADWWAPATAAVSLINAAIVIPALLGAFFPPTMASAPSTTMAMLGGAIALGAGGVLTGAAQAFILRRKARNVAWLWIPATAMGGALTAVATTALASQLYGLPAVATISVAAATSSLLTAAAQTPVLYRVLR